LGFVDDFWFHYVGNVGNAGPDKCKAVKFLLLPLGYTGEVPKDYFVFRSQTLQNSSAAQHSRQEFLVVRPLR
jgi:hypothetical protein